MTLATDDIYRKGMGNEIDNRECCNAYSAKGREGMTIKFGV